MTVERPLTLTEAEQFKALIRVAQSAESDQLARAIGQFYFSFVIPKIKPALIKTFDQKIDLQSIDEALQDVAERLMRAVIAQEFTLRTMSTLCYWCGTVAYRRLSNMLRQASVHPVVCLDGQGGLVDEYDLEAFDPCIPGYLMMSLSRIRAPERKRVFELFIKGYTAEEIARMLGKRVSTVHRTLSRVFEEVRGIGILPRP